MEGCDISPHLFVYAFCIYMKEIKWKNYKKRIDFLIKQNDKKQEIIDKAIEYIKHNITKISKEEFELWLICGEVDHLLEILKGDSNE